MLLKTLLIGGIVAAGQATSINLGPVNSLLSRDATVEDVLGEEANLVATLTRRQNSNPVDTAPLASLTPASGDASRANLTGWEADTRKACMDTLNNLQGQATNPSGIVVCYNLPFLDNRTGVFQAELRMYNVSAPVDPWVGVTAADVSMTLSYLGATVQNMPGNFSKRDVTWPPVREVEVQARDGLLVERQNPTTLTEMKVLMYVGRVNSNLMGAAMNQESLKSLLVPQIDLSARNPVSGKDVEATLADGGGATFVNGVFSKAASGPTNIDPQAAASASAAAQSAAPFVVPGQTLDTRVLLVGPFVTVTWAILFFTAVGFGTFGRIQFRDQYRRRVKAEASRGVRTI